MQIFICLFCPYCADWNSSSMLNKSESKHLFVSSLRGKAFNFIMKCDIVYRFVVDALYQVKETPLYSKIARSFVLFLLLFYHEWMLLLSKGCFPASTYMIMIIFLYLGYSFAFLLILAGWGSSYIKKGVTITRNVKMYIFPINYVNFCFIYYEFH